MGVWSNVNGSLYIECDKSASSARKLRKHVQKVLEKICEEENIPLRQYIAAGLYIKVVATEHHHTGIDLTSTSISEKEPVDYSHAAIVFYGSIRNWNTSEKVRLVDDLNKIVKKTYKKWYYRSGSVSYTPQTIGEPYKVYILKSCKKVPYKYLVSIYDAEV